MQSRRSCRRGSEQSLSRQDYQHKECAPCYNILYVNLQNDYLELSMEYLIEYDKANPKSIEAYAKRLIGHTFNDVKEWNLSSLVREDGLYENKSRKGGLGNFIEEQFFGYRANSESQADFPEAGVELKVTPYEIKKNGELSAGERLVLTMISYENEIEPDFYKSHVWKKCQLMLLIYYLRDKALSSNMDYHIDFVQLFQIPEKDMNIILNDYKIITDKIKAGNAHELSESDTMYLGACTKGSTAAKSMVPQYYNKEVKAKKRAFCLKNSYMTYVLNNYIVPGKETYVESIASTDELKDQSFAELLQKRLSRYVGLYEDDIAREVSIEMNKGNKSYEATLVYSMLGVKNTHVEEFDKAGILVKILKYRKQKSKNQQFRLDDIKFIDFDNEKMDNEILDEEGNPIGWEYSALYSMLSNRKYLFAVFWEDENGSIFKGSQLWGMPDDDIEAVREVWSRTKTILRNGIEFTIKCQNGKPIVENNLPGIRDNGIFHIRPHAAKAYYKFPDGRSIGSGSLTDTDLLPDGTRMTKQAYWLNRAYIDEQIVSELRMKY